ncbi:MAG: rRNA maturation RNase YbeY [Acidimicrobiia bacterium]|nr:rRNA maturation RNase YbeY [Acidimicrobiia bacterium]
MSEPRRGAPPRRRRGPDDGTLSVFVANEQGDHEVDTDCWRTLAEAVLADEGVDGDAEVSLLFVDRATIAELNALHREVNGPTDVLAFPIDGDLVAMGRHPHGGPGGPARPPQDPDDLPLLLGDVVICPDVAAANAPAHAGTYDDEVALLVVHGLLHLLGMDHADDDERRVMQATERRHLDRHWRALARDPWRQ